MHISPTAEIFGSLDSSPPTIDIPPPACQYFFPVTVVFLSDSTEVSSSYSNGFSPFPIFSHHTMLFLVSKLLHSARYISFVLFKYLSIRLHSILFPFPRIVTKLRTIPFPFPKLFHQTTHNSLSIPKDFPPNFAQIFFSP